MKMALSLVFVTLLLAACGSDSQAEKVADRVEEDDPGAIAAVCKLRAVLGEGGTKAALISKWEGSPNEALAAGYDVRLDDLAEELVSRCD